MTAAEFKSIRQSLGLSVAQMAEVLGFGLPYTGDPVVDAKKRKNAAAYVRHMELPQSMRSSVPVSEKNAKLMRAYVDGHRPEEWPNGLSPR